MAHLGTQMTAVPQPPPSQNLLTVPNRQVYLPEQPSLFVALSSPPILPWILWSVPSRRLPPVVFKTN